MGLLLVLQYGDVSMFPQLYVATTPTPNDSPCGGTVQLTPLQQGEGGEQ